MVDFHFVMKLKLAFPPLFAKTTRRMLFLVPCDATAVKGTPNAVIETFRNALLLSSSVKTDNTELGWAPDFSG